MPRQPSLLLRNEVYHVHTFYALGSLEGLVPWFVQVRRLGCKTV